MPDRTAPNDPVAGAADTPGAAATTGTATSPGRATSTLPPGAPVEVRTRFLADRWARGFDVARCGPTGGYTLRRRSDRSLLPVEVPAADVRPDLGADPAALAGARTAGV